MNLTEAEKRTTEWMQAENHKLGPTAPRLPGTMWSYQALVGGVYVGVTAARSRPYVMVAARVRLSDEDQAAYERLPEDEREAFHEGVRRWAYGDVCDFEYNFDPRLKDWHCQITRCVYPDDLTRQEFMDAVRKVHHLATAVISHAHVWFRERGGVRR